MSIVDEYKIHYLSDYKPPAFWCTEVILNINIAIPESVDEVQVIAEMQFERNTANHDATQLCLYGENLFLVELHLNNTPLLCGRDYVVTAKDLTIFAIPDQFKLRIITKINPKTNKALSGLYLSGPHYITQCEPFGFRRITYSLDRSDVLSVYTTTIEAPLAYQDLLSNGNLVASGTLSNGRHWAKWHDPFPKPSYLFAMVAGNFAVLEDQFVTASSKTVTLKIYAEADCINDCHHAMHALKKAMHWDEINYGREYDLDLYSLVAVKDFNMGAMENKGLNVFNVQTLLASPTVATDDDYMYVESVVAHEYFHNWTGNRVTCRDWFQLSLKEGLTVFRDQSFFADMVAPDVARIQDVADLRARQFFEDSGPLAHPVRPASYIQLDNFYTSTVYDKGAEVVRILRTILGVEKFRAAMDLYFVRHDGQAVTVEDFVKIMTEAGNLDYHKFMRWYTQIGTPQVKVTAIYDQDAATYTMQFSQFYHKDHAHQDPVYIPINLSLLAADGKFYNLNAAGDTELMLNFHTKNLTHTFTNIAAKPVPSLLRSFSAPVNLDYDYTDAELSSLFSYDNNPVTRWDAGQQYATRVLLRLGEAEQKPGDDAVPEDFISTWCSVLHNLPDNKFFAAQLLNLPPLHTIIANLDHVLIDNMTRAYDQLSKVLATRLRTEWLQCYHAYNDSDPSYNMDNVGRRKLKNLALRYLMSLEDHALHAELGMKQFNDSLALNMNDTLASLATLAHIDSDLRVEAFARFYDTWCDNDLVMDKWLALQASAHLPGTSAQVEQLLSHKVFSWYNPNKVSALLGSFSRNWWQFHDSSGSGYRLLVASVLKIDKFNPLLAARLVKPLLDWQRYDAHRQALLGDQLRLILATQQLSTDVYELLTKSLPEDA